MNKRQKENVSVDPLNGNDNSQLIPIDVIIMIFAKLSLKSIARCRCVSKLWASILRLSDFTELFLSKSLSSIPKLLLACQKNDELVFFSSLQPQNLDGDSYSVLASYQMKFSCSVNYAKFYLVNGLFCFDDWDFLNGNMEKVVKICNPSTGQVITSPEVRTSNTLLCSLLEYDPIDKQFKVLSMRNSEKRSSDMVCEEYQLLTLGSGNLSWRMLECSKPHNPPLKNICITGVLYYTYLNGQIACFDVRLETFSFVKTMETFNGSVHNGSVDLINYNGKLGMLQLYVGNNKFLLFDGENINFKLWV